MKLHTLFTGMSRSKDYQKVQKMTFFQRQEVIFEPSHKQNEEEMDQSEPGAGNP